MEIIQTILSYSDDVLAILGGLVIVAVPIVKWTKTTADDLILDKFSKAVQWLVLNKDQIEKLKTKDEPKV